MTEKTSKKAAEEFRQRFNLASHVCGLGWKTNPCRFEILAVTAGEGNGWLFSPHVLRESLPLWDGVECFIDHSLAERSVRDLAGVFSRPVWDESAPGVRVTLTPGGPGAQLLNDLGKEVLQQPAPKAHVGFSADLLFSANGKAVERILKVFSIDLVVNPARGGAFLRALDGQPGDDSRETIQTGKETHMTQATDPQNGQNAQNQPALLQDAAQNHPQAVRALLGAPAAVQNSPACEKDAPTALEICENLLDTALLASRLPMPMRDQICDRFAGRVFIPVELHKAIDQARDLVSQLSGAAAVQGVQLAQTGGRMQGMFDTRDQLQAAADDLLGAPRSRETAGLKVHKLQGIRELYMLLTGDYDLYGGYYPQHARLAGTADFSGLVANSLNKVVSNTWDVLGRAGYDWWKDIVTVEHFNTLNTITGTLVGTVGSLPEVEEGAEYTELSVGDSPETGTFLKYGGYIPLTLELIDRDETRKLSAYPRELASAGLRKVSQLVSDIFTSADGVGPTMADSGALFNSTAVTSAGGHANLSTAELSAANWDAACKAVYEQPMLVKNAAGLYGRGPKMAINPRYLLVPRALQLTAMKILYPSLENAANIYSENMQRGQPGDVKVVPEWTDPASWAAVCDPRITPAVYIGERFGLMPEIFIAGDSLSPAVFSNDEHRLKVRHFLAVWVNDFRPLHKSNVPQEGGGD